MKKISKKKKGSKIFFKKNNILGKLKKKKQKKKNLTRALGLQVISIHFQKKISGLGALAFIVTIFLKPFCSFKNSKTFSKSFF